ncbi:MAG: type II secretion system protein [Micavibrio sp.]
MSRQSLTAVRSQAGFTLVELAVVMIIIGLLIGGVLKGQELINNAQITSTVAQIKAMDAAVSTFDDMYSALPGDMLAPVDRLPSCDATGGCSTPGNGNRTLSNTLVGAPAGEGLTFFVHLAAADLLTGINPAGGTVWGGIFPESNINGGFHAGSSAGALADFLTPVGANLPARGLYLAITDTAGAAPVVTLTPNQAFRIDNKIDDSSPDSGSVRGYGANCDGTTTAVYDESNPAQVCGVYVRIQG